MKYRGKTKTRIDAIKRYFNGFELREAPRAFSFTTIKQDEKKAYAAMEKGHRRELVCTGCQAILRQFPETKIGDVMILKTRAYIKLPAGYFGSKKECVWHFKVNPATRKYMIDNFDNRSPGKDPFNPDIYIFDPPQPSITFAAQSEYNKTVRESVYNKTREVPWGKRGASHHGRPLKYADISDKQNKKVYKSMDDMAARTSKPWQWRFDNPQGRNDE